MPWKNDDKNEGGGKKPPKNPWGAGSPEGSDDRNPWGGGGGGSGGEPPKPSGDRPKSISPDFDEFIRRSQERLRGLGGGGGGRGRPPSSGGGFSSRQFPVGPIIAVISLIFLASTSAYRVDAGERAIITRFGKFVQTNGPGFHFKLPSPIERVQKVNFERIRTMQIGNVNADSENLMITGDQNIINIVYQVRWRLKNAEDFQFRIAEQEDTVRDATESAMRAMIGRSTLINAIGPERAAIAEQVRELVQETLDSYGAGVLVQGIDINKADPPAAVDEAFKDVSAAQQDAEQYMNQASAYAQQIAAQAAGEIASFDKVYAEYKLAPAVTRKRMYLETMQDVMSKVDKTVVEASGVQTYLPLSELRRHSASTSASEDEK